MPWREAHRKSVYGKTVRTVVADALARLTWKNLGDRLGQRVGAWKPADIDAVFATLATGWPPPQALV